MKASIRVLIVLFAFAAPLFAADETIRIEPANPRSVDPLRITVSGVWGDGCPPRFEGSDRKEGELTLRFAVQVDGPCPAVLTPWSGSASVVPLPAGKWDVRAVVDMQTGVRLVALTTVTVAPAEPPVALIPASSRMEGGASVLLRAGGIGSCEPCPGLRVLFGGNEASAVRVVSSSEIAAVPAPHDPGRVDVTILGSGLGAEVALPASFLYYDSAEGPPEEAFERILIPVMFDGDGAFGSRWMTKLTVHNRGAAGIDPWNSITRCDAGERCRPQLPAGATLHLWASALGNWMHGYLFAVPREQADDLVFTLHVRDLSRQTESLGTEIPVVREKDLPQSPITLLDVPLNPAYRKMLRIYDLNGVDGTRVTMRWRLDDGTQIGADQHLVLRTLIRCVTTPCWFPEPAGLATPLFESSLPPVVTQDYLRVEIEPLTPGSRIWAFVTITSNATQQVTTITP